MEILFKSNKLEKQLNSQRDCQKTWGANNGKKIQQRMAELSAAETLSVMFSLPCNCHELKQNRAGQFTVDAKYPYRLIFEPAHDPIPRKEDGGIDPSRITRIRIIEVVDYHGD